MFPGFASLVLDSALPYLSDVLLARSRNLARGKLPQYFSVERSWRILRYRFVLKRPAIF